MWVTKDRKKLRMTTRFLTLGQTVYLVSHHLSLKFKRESLKEYRI